MADDMPYVYDMTHILSSTKSHCDQFNMLVSALWRSKNVVGNHMNNMYSNIIRMFRHSSASFVLLLVCLYCFFFSHCWWEIPFGIQVTILVYAMIYICILDGRLHLWARKQCSIIDIGRSRNRQVLHHG